MPRSIVPAFLAVAILCAPIAHASVFTGKVVEVTSGQTLVIVDDKGKIHKVRLHAVACPVEEQPYFDAAQKALERVALNKRAWVDWFDKKGAVVVGKVFVNSEDIAIKLLRRGAVWYDRREACDQSVSDRGLYAEAQDDAVRQKAGLWRDAHAVEPWLWQKAAQRAEKAIAVGTKRKNKK